MILTLPHLWGQAWLHRTGKLLLPAALLLAACSRPTESVGPEIQSALDPVSVVYTAAVKNGAMDDWTTFALPGTAHVTLSVMTKTAADGSIDQPAAKIHPVLTKWLATASPTQREQVIVTFYDNIVIPVFPEPLAHEERESASNKSSLATAQSMIVSLQERRAGEYQRLQQEFEQQYRAEVIQTFWLLKSMLIQLPLSAITAVAERPDVAYVEPDQAGEQPPQAVETVQSGRDSIGSDYYLQQGDFRTWIGLLDSGVRASHIQLQDPDRIGLQFDCTKDACRPVTSAAEDCYDHGTSSAAVLSANSNQGESQRGVTAALVDSYQVYVVDCSGLSVSAALRGFEQAVSMLDRVIVASLQSRAAPAGALATAANHAFDAGAVIVAPLGYEIEEFQQPGPSTARAPANAHKVIGVGAIDSTGRIGPDNGIVGRVKPDLLLPTNVQTAGSTGDQALRFFTGTSAAAAYAGGVAVLLRDWLRVDSAVIDPGQVNVWMILAGQDVYPFALDRGAGALHLPGTGRAWWGKVSVVDGSAVDIALDLSEEYAMIDGALWWPEAPDQPHSDLDLYLLAPDGVQSGSSTAVSSIFERARVIGAPQTGIWQLRIEGYSVPGQAQTVYWAAYAQP